MTMKPVTREQWTAALRSGQYQQCKRSLYDGEGGYCCLGVLGVLAGGRVEPPWEGIQFGSGMARTGYLPDDIAALVGIYPDEQCKLVDMNDTGKTFAEIADYLDALFDCQG